jgi:hypothetical protein
MLIRAIIVRGIVDLTRYYKHPCHHICQIDHRAFDQRAALRRKVWRTLGSIDYLFPLQNTNAYPKFEMIYDIFRDLQTEILPIVLR